jgi:hypothetical protein
MARPKRVFVFYILLVLVCAAVLCAVVWYKSRIVNRIRVYDLTWQDTTDANEVVYRRWRYYIETKTNLPRKIEKFYKQDHNAAYVLQETLVIGYPTADEIKKFIKDARLED